MAPQPKPPGARVRRNKDQPQWRQLPAGGRAGKVPTLPTKRPSWLKQTREWWKTIWASPMAAAWLPSDVPTLQRLALLVELVGRGDVRAEVLSEIRQLEDRFGLSPKSRRALQWEIAAGDEASGESEKPDKPLATVRRLRAV